MIRLSYVILLLSAPGILAAGNIGLLAACDVSDPAAPTPPGAAKVRRRHDTGRSYEGDLFAAYDAKPDPRTPNAPTRDDALLYRKLPVPRPFLVTRDDHTFGGDVRIGDLNGDGRCDFLVYRCNHGAPSGAHRGGIKPCFLGAFDIDGKLLWEKKLGRNMDSVAIAEWDGGNVRAICSGFGHVLGAEGELILSLGEKEVPHGQEVRVANLRDDLPGPEMVLRNTGHTTDALLVSSATNRIVDRFQLNFSPTNVGMEPVYWRGPDKAALLYNGGWLWDLKRKQGRRLPHLPPPGGDKVHRMGFYHAIPADLCGDNREELVLWDPTARHIYIYTAKPFDGSHRQGYVAGPRQYNPRLMD